MHKIRTVLGHLSFALETGSGLCSKMILVAWFLLVRSFSKKFRRLERTISIRANGVVVLVRLRVQDYYIAHEIFGERVYQPLVDGNRTGKPVVLDIGAHIGLASIFFATAMPQATVVAIEPSPDNFRLLSINLKLFGERVVIHQAAVADKEGMIEFYPNPYAQSSSSLRDRSLGERVAVEAVTVDSLVERYRPTLGKFDIENQELIVFGASRLKSRLAAWIGEVRNDEAYIADLGSLFGDFPLSEIVPNHGIAYIYFAHSA